MNDSARKRGLVGEANVGRWTPDEDRAYETARDLTNALIAAYSARLYVTPEGEERLRLLSDQRECSEQQRKLTVFSGDDIQRILNDYPARIHRVREASQ